MLNVFAYFIPTGLLLSLYGYNERLRTQARRLVEKGVTQKVLAEKMGMPTSSFSKWLNGKLHREVSVRALDGLEAYMKELIETLQETQRQEVPKKPSGTAGDYFRQAANEH